MSAPTKDVPVEVAEEHLAELGRLTDTAGGKVVSVVTQRIDRPNPATYIGSGKVEELASAVAMVGADLVIFDEELTPGQGMNLERKLGVRVMDRPELILDIFATRARSREARLQVELAQLEYLLPRLTRMWSHLSRIRGGIGLRGPGETQLETDRRLIGERIADLKEKLRGVAKSRATQRKQREGTYRAALVGYTNAGKSSLLSALSGADVFVEDRLFATLDSATRSVDLGSGYESLLTDTVGFIRKLPHHLIASFRSTLEEAREADLLLLVADASHTEWEEQLGIVEDVLDELSLGDRPRVLVFNKMDCLTSAERASLERRVRALESLPAVFVSALSDEGVRPLRDTLRARVRARYPEVDIDVPADEGGVLASIYREGEVVERSQNGSSMRLRARVPEPLLGRLAAHGRVKIHSRDGG